MNVNVEVIERGVMRRLVDDAFVDLDVLVGCQLVGMAVRRNGYGPSNDSANNLGKGIVVAKLIYSAITSLDGYVADDEGNFDWAEPDEELHLFVNDLERSVGTYLYGRRMYETMVFWETAHTLDDQPQYILDYAGIWQRAEKIVYSTTLASVSSERSRIEPEFDPAAVREMKASLTNDISVGGPRLAAQAFKVGLVDECHLFLNPVVVGSGNRALLPDGRVDLDLLGERRFGNGVVHLHYRVVPTI